MPEDKRHREAPTLKKKKAVMKDIHSPVMAANVCVMCQG